jgi:hypothetical protein
MPQISSKMNVLIEKSHKINSQVLTNTREALSEPLANGLDVSTGTLRQCMDKVFVDVMGLQVDHFCLQHLIKTS